MITSSYPAFNEDMRGSFIYTQVREMSNRGYNLVILTPHIPGSPFQEKLDGVIIYRFPYFLPFSFQQLCGKGGLYFGFKRNILGKLQVIPYFIMMVLYSGFLIRKHKISLIHTHWIIPQGIAGCICQMITGIPHLATSHVLDITISDSMPYLQGIISFVLRHTHIATVNSSFTRDQLTRFSPPNLPIFIIPMGVDENRMKSNTDYGFSLPRKQHSILFVGRLIDWKGVDTLIKAFKRVYKEYPDATLEIIGEGPERSRYEEMTRIMGLESIVHFRGLVSDSELNSAYNQAGLFILPSQKKNGVVMEGLGVVLLEAISHGVPVIGSRIGGIVDIIDDGITGYLAEPGDEQSLAEQAIRVFANPLEAFQTVTRARSLISEKFSWDRLGAEFDTIYHDLLYDD